VDEADTAGVGAPGATLSGASTVGTPPPNGTGTVNTPADVPPTPPAEPTVPGMDTTAPPAEPMVPGATPGMPTPPVAGAPTDTPPVDVPPVVDPVPPVAQPPAEPEDVAPPTPTLIGDVTFSVPSGTFATEFTVTLTGPEGAEIRYTTDGTLPTAESPLYDGTPLTVAATTQLRAAPFTAGAAAGFGSTAIYVQRAFDTPSDLPIVIMEGYAGGRPQKQTPGFGGGNMEQEEPAPDAKEWYELGFMLFEPVDGVASIAATPTLVTRAGYRERGQSSAGAEKSPYRVEFWNNQNEDADYPVLGMPADSDWAMIGEFYDKTQIRNSLVFHWGDAMGLVTMERRFAELYINFDGGPLEEADYFGVYAISETIKNQDDRVDINNLAPEEVAEPEVTGGYIFKFDQAALDSDEPVIECTGSALLDGAGGGGFGGGQEEEMPAEAGHCFQYLGITDPSVVNEQQLTWLTNYVQSFHDALHSEPIGDYAQYIDVPSFIDHLLIGEVTRNVDAFVRSQYFHKDREGLIKAGPLWDYNFSLGSINSEAEGWHAESQLTSRGNDDWFYKLEQDPAFIAQVAARWRELRQGVLADAAISQKITELAAPLVNAGPRDLARWPNSGFGGFGGGGGDDAAAPETYEDHIQVLRDYIPARMAWLDEALSVY
jgi:CotH kinase protein/Chitobiase/beta-hexosaminidase C-terminal domain